MRPRVKEEKKGECAICSALLTELSPTAACRFRADLAQGIYGNNLRARSPHRSDCHFVARPSRRTKKRRVIVVAMIPP
jgi:hypothetical protein